MQKPIFFTKQGYENLQKEYDEMTKSRPLAVMDLSKAREMGDLSENGYYKSARMKLSQVDRRLRELKHLLKVGKVQTTTGSTVDIGTTVTLLANGNEFVYHIVGTYEANPSEGKISLSSPLGKVLAGKRKGDSVEFSTPTSSITYRIISLV